MELYFIVGNVVMLLHEMTFYRCFPFLFLLFAVQICCVAMGAACNRNGDKSSNRKTSDFSLLCDLNSPIT